MNAFKRFRLLRIHNPYRSLPGSQGTYIDAPDDSETKFSGKDFEMRSWQDPDTGAIYTDYFEVPTPIEDEICGDIGWVRCVFGKDSSEVYTSPDGKDWTICREATPIAPSVVLNPNLTIFDSDL